MKVYGGERLSVAKNEHLVLELCNADGSCFPVQVLHNNEIVYEGESVELSQLGVAPPAQLLLTSKDGHIQTHIDFISHQYFSLDALRYSDDETDDFATKGERELFDARQSATETFERACNRSFVPRIGQTKVYGLNLVNLAHCDVCELINKSSYELINDCQAESLHPEKIVTLRYIYGLNYVPAQVSRAVLKLAASFLRHKLQPDNATGESTQAGFIRFTIAGRDGATNIPEVNETARQFGRGEWWVCL